MELKDYLVSAKNKILESGWIQGDYGDEERGYCAMGALSRVNDEVVEENGGDAYSLYSGAVRALRIQLRRQEGFTVIPAWNDADDRTESDVLDLFDNTISNL